MLRRRSYSEADRYSRRRLGGTWSSSSTVSKGYHSQAVALLGRDCVVAMVMMMMIRDGRNDGGMVEGGGAAM